jgi:hypothetical protein
MHIAQGHMSFRGVNSILEACCTSKTVETSNVGSLEWSTCEEVETSYIEWRKLSKSKR